MSLTPMGHRVMVIAVWVLLVVLIFAEFARSWILVGLAGALILAAGFVVARDRRAR